MDKRLYRMRQLNWKLRSTATEIEIIEGHMNEYRQVLYEWNDNLNRNLALTLRYFGKEIRKDLEGIVYEEFKKIGSLLEKAYSERKKDKTAHSESLDKEIILLGYHVYNLNVRMIALIQNGKVGIFNPDTSRRTNDNE